MGAWIETCGVQPKQHDNKSHPSWVRGLKLGGYMTYSTLSESHPSWVRGLKPHGGHNKATVGYVAPLVGAWIETLQGAGGTNL